MKPQKPLTDNKKERCREVYEMFKIQDVVTKEEIIKKLNLTSERIARDIISEIAKYRPIISTSDSKGYRMAKKLSDLEDVEHCWKELDSRIEELEERKKALIKFYDNAREKMNG